MGEPVPSRGRLRNKKLHLHGKRLHLSSRWTVKTRETLSMTTRDSRLWCSEDREITIDLILTARRRRHHQLQRSQKLQQARLQKARRPREARERNQQEPNEQSVQYTSQFKSSDNCYFPNSYLITNF